MSIDTCQRSSSLMSRFQPKLGSPLILIHVGILATFGLIPVWKRFSTQEPPPLFLPNLYVSYFWILLPMLWSIVWWLILRLPGFDLLRRDTVRAGWALALLLLALWTLASRLWAFQRDAHPEVAASASLQFSVAALFAVVVACAAPSRRAIIGMLVIGLLWNSIVTIGQVVTQGSIGLRGLGEFTLGVNQPGIGYVQADDTRWLRPYGLLPHPNMLAGFFAVGLLAVAPWLFARQHVLWRAGILVFTLGLWSFLLTFSRGAWLGFAAGIFAMLPLVVRGGTTVPASALGKLDKLLLASWRLFISPRVLIIFTVCLAVGLPFALTFRSFLEARAGVGGESIELRSISDRVVFATFAYGSIIERPIIGVGMGNFPWRASFYLMRTNYDLRGDNVHHVLLSAWAELGLVGLLLVIIALVMGTEAVLRNLRQSEGDNLPDRPYKIALLGGFAALTTIGLLDHYPWTILHFQVAWWGLLAAAIKPSDTIR
jgi:O-antigen ligase